MKLATWFTPDGVMSVVVVSGFEAFERLINSHPKMAFIDWETA